MNLYYAGLEKANDLIEKVLCEKM